MNPTDLHPDLSAEPSRVKTLVFEAQGDPEDQIERCETPFGVYELQGFPSGYMVTFRWHHTARRIHDRIGLQRDGAVDMAQADFDLRVSGCLAPVAPASAAKSARRAP